MARTVKSESGGEVERTEFRIGPDTRYELVIVGPRTPEAMARLRDSVSSYCSIFTDDRKTGPVAVAGGR